MPGFAVGQQPPELPDQPGGAGGRESGRGMGGEIGEPAGRVIQPGGQAAGGDERPLGVLLPATVAQSQPGVAAELAAPGADPGRVFRWGGP